MLAHAQLTFDKRGNSSGLRESQMMTSKNIGIHPVTANLLQIKVTQVLDEKRILATKSLCMCQLYKVKT